MDPDELCSLLIDRFPQFDTATVRAVLREHDNRVGPSNDALEEMSSRQGTNGASSSRQGTFNEDDEREAQIRRDALLARSMQDHSLGNQPMRRGNGGGGSSNLLDDSWSEALNTMSTTFEAAVDYASTLGGWASDMIATLDPTTLLFEDDEDYDHPNRPPPDTTNDREGVSINRTPLTQRARLQPDPVAPADHSDDEDEEGEDFDDSAGAQLAAWLGGEEEVSYAKKDK